MAGQQYNIRVTNTARVVLTLIFIPLLIVPILVGTALYLPNLPDWFVMVEVCVFLSLAIVATIATVKKVSPVGVVTVNDDGFTVDFPKKSLFTPASFEIKINQVTNFYVEGGNGLYYMSFKTSVVPSGFNIEAVDKKEENMTPFLELMGVISGMVERNNKTFGSTSDDSATSGGSSAAITSVTMYEKPWAKILVVISVILLIAVVLMAIFKPGSDNASWWRVGAFLAFGLPFAWKVYYHNYRKKK